MYHVCTNATTAFHLLPKNTLKPHCCYAIVKHYKRYPFSESYLIVSAQEYFHIIIITQHKSSFSGYSQAIGNATKHTDKQTETQPDTHRQTQTCRQKERSTDANRDKEAGRQTDRPRHRQTRIETDPTTNRQKVTETGKQTGIETDTDRPRDRLQTGRQAGKQEDRLTYQDQ